MKVVQFKITVFLSFLSFSNALENSDNSNYLRGKGIVKAKIEVTEANSVRKLNPMFCGCPGCNEDAFNNFAGEFKCGDRINYLQSSLGFSERDACARVAGAEFPEACGICDPDNCIEEPFPPPPPSRTRCGCPECEQIWYMMAGEYTCGERIEWLQSDTSTVASGPYDELSACSKVASEEFSNECGKCDPSRCNRSVTMAPSNAPTTILTKEPTRSPTSTSSQKCGGAVNASSDSSQTCQSDLWNPTGDTTMHCFAYGGRGDPCHLNNNNDPDDGRNKSPSSCFGDTFYLWDEPDTQGKSYRWAGQTWLEYSRRFSNELRALKAQGTKITSPMLTSGSEGTITRNLGEFLSSCGPACTDRSDPAYIDVIAVNSFCGDFNGPTGCRGGASFIYKEVLNASSTFGNRPVYITNWSRLQTSDPWDQVGAINAIEEFFPSSAASRRVVERVYWFGATDFGGNSSNNFLTQILADGKTLGELWKEKCDSLT